MRVRLLGTGSADGWPNPFCRCASCAAQASAHELRGPTSALVDGVLMLDCGPEAPRAAVRAGEPLDRLSAVLLTHAHPDHSAPMALLSRAWAARREPLTVVGPGPVIDPWREWVLPADGVDFRSVDAGDVLDVAGYRVRVLPADHPQPAVLYTVTGPDGDRLFYAADTGPLPAAALDALAAEPVDLALLEETFGDAEDHGTQHLDLTSFGREIGRLRAAGALREGAEVVAVHLSHHNPPEAALGQRLAAWGARAGLDGEVIGVGGQPPPPPLPDLCCGRDHTGPRMTSRTQQKSGGAVAGDVRRTLVLGGARSGKSTAAERLLGAEPCVLYVATGPAAGPPGTPWADRVRRHRERRPAGWVTCETPDAASALREARRPVLLDCLGTWLTGVLDDVGAWDDAPGWAEQAQERVDELVAALRDVAVPVVVVSNEVGSGVVPATVSGGLFRDWLGRLNQGVATESERVLLVVAGRTIEL